MSVTIKVKKNRASEFYSPVGERNSSGNFTKRLTMCPGIVRRKFLKYGLDRDSLALTLPWLLKGALCGAID